MIKINNVNLKSFNLYKAFKNPELMIKFPKSYLPVFEVMGNGDVFIKPFREYNEGGMERHIAVFLIFDADGNIIHGYNYQYIDLNPNYIMARLYRNASLGVEFSLDYIVKINDITLSWMSDAKTGETIYGFNSLDPSTLTNKNIINDCLKIASTIE